MLRRVALWACVAAALGVALVGGAVAGAAWGLPAISLNGAVILAATVALTGAAWGAAAADEAAAEGESEEHATFGSPGEAQRSDLEAAIQQNLTRLMHGKTVIAIAHRLSTIARMDRLVVLDRGRIVEQGTHDALLAAGGHYAALWRRQSGGFIDAPDLLAAE